MTSAAKTERAGNRAVGVERWNVWWLCWVGVLIKCRDRNSLGACHAHFSLRLESKRKDPECYPASTSFPQGPKNLQGSPLEIKERSSITQKDP